MGSIKIAAHLLRASGPHFQTNIIGALFSIARYCYGILGIRGFSRVSKLMNSSPVMVSFLYR